MSNDKLPVNAQARKIQIDLITDTPNDIHKWFIAYWGKLYVAEVDLYLDDGNEFIYYKFTDKGRQWVFFQNDERFYCNYQYYWMLMESKFRFGYNDIECITKVLIEHVLNKEIAVPDGVSAFDHAINDNFNNILPSCELPISVMDNK